MLPLLLQSPRKDTHCIEPTPRGGAGRLPAAVNAERRGLSEPMRKVWGTSHLALSQAFKAPASITQSPLKRVFRISPDIRLEAVLSPSPSFTLEGGTRRNPLTRCRSWRTSSGCGNCPLGGDGECEPRALATVLPSPPASPVTRGAAVSGAVSRVSSTSHRCRRPSLARPGDRWAVPTSSAA